MDRPSHIVPLVLALLLLLALCTAPRLDASTSARSVVRLAPGDVWCPTGLTFGEGRPGHQSSIEGVFDRGDFETSFRAPTNGWVYLTLVATSDIAIDNLLVMPRERYFPPVLGHFDSDACHRAADPTFPRVRVATWNADSLPDGARLERFAVADIDALRDRGWEINGATIDLTESAVERLPVGDQGAVTAVCPAAGATLCPDGTGSLMLPAGQRVRLPVRVAAGVDYLAQLWWKGPPGARLDVRIDDFAPCPEAPEGLFVDHASELEIQVLNAELSAGIDPELFFFLTLIEDESDTFGRVTVDSETFTIPQIDNDDNPSWEGRANFAVGELNDPSAVPIKIELFDNDEFDNAHVDLDPNPGDKDLDLVVDLCRMQVEGDLSVDMQGPIEARGDAGSGDDQGLLRFTISSASGRPMTTDDLAVVDLDFVQAVHGSRYAVTEKPGVVMVSVANNFEVSVDTEILVELFGPGGFFVSRRVPVTLPPLDRDTFYLFGDAPIFPPSPTPGVESFLGINVQVDPDGVFSGGLPPGDCRIDNDTVSEKMWKLVETDDLTVTWCKVARVLELPQLVDNRRFDEIQTLGTDFMRATFPTASVTAARCPTATPLTPNAAVLEWIGTVFEAFDIPALAGHPFAMVWDLNNFAALTGVEKMLGIVPRASWYQQFEGWDTVRGNSLGEAAPHAAILLPEVEDDAGVAHPMVTLPAHELAHTYGLSADPHLKDTASCGVTILGDPFGLGDLICGATGGLDEYSASDPARARGNPATGYWLELGTEDPRLAAHVDRPQCDRHCFMGAGPPDQLGNWIGHGAWIDTNDWEHLIERMKRHPDPEVIFLGGMIDPADNAFLAPWYRLPAGIPDRVDEAPGGYRARFYDGGGELLQDVGFPVGFHASDSPTETPPITFFGFTTPWVPGTARIDIDRGGDGDGIPPATVATRTVSASVPTVSIVAPSNGSAIPDAGPLQLAWQAEDADGDELSALVMASLDGDFWSVVHNWTTASSASLDPSLLPGTIVQLKVFVTDGVHGAESGPIEVDASRLLFMDGFETGDTSRWGSSIP